MIPTPKPAKKCGEKFIDYTPIVEDDREDVLFMSNLSPDEPEEQKTEVKTAEAAPLFDGEPKLLITVIGSGEADRITEMLEQNKIPSMKKGGRGPHLHRGMRQRF